MDFKFQDILQTQHTRKQFLTYAGVILLGLLGVSAFMRRFKRATGKSVSSGYGSTAYGGK